MFKCFRNVLKDSLLTIYISIYLFIYVSIGLSLSLSLSLYRSLSLSIYIYIYMFVYVCVCVCVCVYVYGHHLLAIIRIQVEKYLHPKYHSRLYIYIYIYIYIYMCVCVCVCVYIYKLESFYILSWSLVLIFLLSDSCVKKIKCWNINLFFHFPTESESRMASAVLFKLKRLLYLK